MSIDSFRCKAFRKRLMVGSKSEHSAAANVIAWRTAVGFEPHVLNRWPIFLQLVWHICVIGLKERLNTTTTTRDDRARWHLRLAASKPGSRRFLAISTYIHE
jgi:hypothetical protein